MYASFYRQYLEVKSQSKDQLSALCPYHDDQKASLSVNTTTGQFNCHACGERGNAFLFAKKLNILYDQVPGYNPNYKNKSSNKNSGLLATYAYFDELGNLKFQVIKTHTKQFRQRRPDGKGGWINNRKGIKPILYRLQDLVNSQEILIVEGEKDVESLRNLGFVATTNPGGAGEWLNEYNQYLKDKDLICFYDNDEPGKQHIRQIIEGNLSNTKSIKLISLPVGPKEDVSDYLKIHTKKELENLIKTSPIISNLEQVDLLLKDLNDFHLTDAGNAEAISKLYGFRFKFDHHRNKYLIWDVSQHRWLFDDTGEVERLALKATRERQKTAVDIEDKDKRDKTFNWALKSESHYQIQATLRILSTLKPIATTITEFNKNPMLLGCKNGVVDLNKGELRAGKPTDFISMSTHVYFDSDSIAPRWNQFLDEIFLGDTYLIQFVQLCIGYSITGSTKEQVLFILHGTGENGKSVFLNAIRGILGDYAGNTPFSTFIASRFDSTKIPNDIASLVGKRFITSSEVKESGYLNEARIKSLTGGEPVTARFLNREYFTYDPTYKIWLAVNHKPRVSDTSHGFWRRIRVIPFERKFSGSDRDNDLTDKLALERSGILNWAIEGCLEWQKLGYLSLPEKVKNATETYRNEMDIVKLFLDEMTINKTDAYVEGSQLYSTYCKWCEKNGEQKMTGTMFGRKMKELGYEKRPFSANRRVHYFGIGLLEG